MQDQVNEKVVAVSIRTTKLTALVLQAAIKQVLVKMKAQRGKMPRGKQTLKQLMRQNTGISNIEITESNIKDFTATAKKYQVMCKIVVFLHSLRQGKSKFNICRFIRAAERGNKDFFVRLCGILNVVKCAAYCAFNRLNLCNRHISSNAPLISAISSAYTLPVALTRRAI